MSKEHERVGTFCDKCRQVMCKCVSKEQTAVEYLMEKLANQGLLISKDYANFIAYHEAKEMEKKQIAKGFDDGQDIEYEYHINSVKRQFNDGKEYYNDTYGK